MTLRTLTLQSELLALRGLSTLADCGDYFVQSTPSEPDYWMGNQVIVKSAHANPEAMITAFETAFPNAQHRAIVWDVAQIDAIPIRNAFTRLGYEVDTFDALTLQGDLTVAATPEGITLRALRSDADWDAAQALQCEIGQEEGRPAASHAAYLARRNMGRRAQIADDQGQWFGAFDGSDLVASMGMFHDTRTARYQAVETKASHRRRGICAALLRHTALWALDRAPRAKLVIVAEADSAAGRLYRRMGFAHAETLVGVLKSGY